MNKNINQFQSPKSKFTHVREKSLEKEKSFKNDISMYEIQTSTSKNQELAKNTEFFESFMIQKEHEGNESKIVLPKGIKEETSTSGGMHTS